MEKIGISNSSNNLNQNNIEQNEVQYFDDIKPITRNEIFTMVYDNLAGQISKAQITKTVNEYHQIFMKHVNPKFGWIIPGLAQVNFFKVGTPRINSKKRNGNFDGIDFYAYNDTRLLNEVSKATKIDYSITEYIMNDYFDTCIYLISKGYQPGIASTFYTRFIGKKRLSRFFPSGKLRDYAKKNKLRVSIHSLLSKEEV